MAVDLNKLIPEPKTNIENINKIYFFNFCMLIIFSCLWKFFLVPKNITNIIYLHGATAWNGECSRNIMWTSARSTQIRDAWNLPTKINGGSISHRPSNDTSLHLLQTPPHFTWRASWCGINGFNLRLRYGPDDLRLRRQLSYTKVPPVAEHCHSKRLHISRHARHAHIPLLAGRLQARVGPTWPLSDTQSLVVDHCSCSGFVY